MPVIPPGIKPFTIRPPLTSTDKGKPTNNVRNDAQRVLDLIQDERHLTAHDLLQSVQSRIEAWEKENQSSSSSKRRGNMRIFRLPGSRNGTRKPTTAPTVVSEGCADAQALLKAHEEQLVTLENRCRIFRRALRNLNENADWTLASSLFGVKTYYRREEDGSLSLKLEGELKDCPLFEQVCVLKEVDLHYKWAPFCSSSMTVADLDKLDTVGWFVIGLPNFGLSRDGVFRAIGCDNILEDGSIILAGQGIQDIPDGEPPHEDTYLSEDPILEKLEIPPVPTRRGGGRMTLRVVEAIIHVTSPTSARTRLVANLDPNMTFLPQPLLEFVMKNLAGVLLAKLQTAAKRIPRNPVSNEHARRMRDEEDFYRNWLMPKFQAVCDAKGWTMPAVAAFELTEEQLRKDHQFAEKRSHKKNPHRQHRAVSFDIPMVDDQLEPASYRRLNSAPEHYQNVDESHQEHSHHAKTMHDDDGVSELTSRSSRSLPQLIGGTFKAREERKRRKKEEEIARQRLMAAERLRPKEFSAGQQERLDDLRRLKMARNGRSVRGGVQSDDPRVQTEPIPSSSVSLPGRLPALRHADSAPPANNEVPTKGASQRKSVSEKVTDKLYRQGPFTRLFVLLFLTFVMFVLLHPKLLWGLIRPDLVARWYASTSIYMTMARSSLTVVYLLLCTAAHFALCDIALVYAFDSMELGSKAGKKLRKFYSVKVRVGVASLSFGIAVLSTGIPFAKAALRYSCWAVSRLLSFWGPLIPGAAVTLLQGAWAPFDFALGFLGTLWRLVVHTNRVTEALEAAALYGIFVLASLWNCFQIFWIDSIAIVDGKIDVTAWYVEAFSLSKSLLSYSSVFLVTSLVLFNASAKKNAAKTMGVALSDVDDLSTQTSDVDAKSRSRVGGRLPQIPEEYEPKSFSSANSQQGGEGLVRRRKV